MEVLELCKKYRHDGVVAIDLAGDESLNCKAYPKHRMAYEVSMLKHEQDLTAGLNMKHIVTEQIPKPEALTQR